MEPKLLLSRLRLCSQRIVTRNRVVVHPPSLLCSPGLVYLRLCFGCVKAVGDPRNRSNLCRWRPMGPTPSCSRRCVGVARNTRCHGRGRKEFPHARECHACNGGLYDRNRRFSARTCTSSRSRSSRAWSFSSEMLGRPSAIRSSRRASGTSLRTPWRIGLLACRGNRFSSSILLRMSRQGTGAEGRGRGEWACAMVVVGKVGSGKGGWEAEGLARACVLWDVPRRHRWRARWCSSGSPHGAKACWLEPTRAAAVWSVFLRFRRGVSSLATRRLCGSRNSQSLLSSRPMIPARSWSSHDAWTSFSARAGSLSRVCARISGARRDS